MYSLRCTSRVTFLDSIYLQVRPRNRGLPLKVQIYGRVRIAKLQCRPMTLLMRSELSPSWNFATATRKAFGKPSRQDRESQALPRFTQGQGLREFLFPSFWENTTRRAFAVIADRGACRLQSVAVVCQHLRARKSPRLPRRKVMRRYPR